MPAAQPRSSEGNLFDGLAIGVSAACLVHCLALPLVIALLPAWSAWLDVPEVFHLYVLLFALPFSLAVLLRAAFARRSLVPLALGTSGLVLMAAALALGEGLGETVVTSIGALLLAAGHIVNWRRRSRCTNHCG